MEPAGEPLAVGSAWGRRAWVWWGWRARGDVGLVWGRLGVSGAVVGAGLGFLREGAVWLAN